jgi:large subunit ribosomal protein L33
LTRFARPVSFPTPLNLFNPMREQVILECTEAVKEGKPASRYFTTKNKKLQQERIERLKYNPFLRRRTVHKERK